MRPLFLLLLGLQALAAQAPISVGSDRHLFLDDTLLDLERCETLDRRMHPPRNLVRVMKPDQPWEALGFIFYASLVDFEGTAMLYYGAYDAEKGKHLCLATSKDGLHFERPNLGQTEHLGSKENNIFPMEAVEAGVFYDPHASQEKRFRLLHNKHWPSIEKGGVYLSNSADGIHWKEHETRLFPRVPDSQPSAYWNPDREVYGIYLRAWDPLRSIGRVETPDLEAPWPYDESVPPFHIWGEGKSPTTSTELPIVMRPDERDPKGVQLYTSTVFRYPWAKDVFLSFPAAYFLYKGTPLQDRQLNSNDGTFDIQLATSRDGISWNRYREPWVEPDYLEGLELNLVSMATGMIRRGRELHQYFIGWPHTHARPAFWDKNLEDRAEWMKKDLGGIYRATSRVDGFVSLSASNEPTVITTKPLEFTGKKLLLNIDTSGVGRATVALLDESGDAIGEFTHANCTPIHADAIDQVVEWETQPEFPTSQPVRVQVKMRNADLFAIEFGE